MPSHRTLLMYFKRILIHDAAWNIAGTIAGRGAMAFFGIAIARTVSLTDFGHYTALMLFAMMFIAVLGGSITNTVIQAYAIFWFNAPRGLGSHLRSRSLQMIGCTTAIGGILFLCSPIFTEWGAAYAQRDLVILCIIFISLSLLSNFFIGLLSAAQAFRTLAYLQIFNGFVLTVIAIFGMMHIANLREFLLGLCMATTFNAALLLWALWRKIAKHPQILLNSSPFPTLTSLSQKFLPLAAAALAITPAYWLVSLLIERYSPTGDVALFGVALQWFQALALIPTALANVTLPALTHEWQKTKQSGTFDSLRANLYRAIKRNTLFMLPIVAVACLLSPILVNLYKFPQTYAIWVICAAFSASYLLAVQLPAANLLMAAGLFATGGLMNVMWAVVFLLASAFFIIVFRLGPLGGGGALLIAYLTHSIWTFLYLHNLLKPNLSRGKKGII